jgi:hypothetical protein
MQFFKGDETEIKFYESGRELLQNLSNEKTSFFNQAYFCYLLGDVIVEDIRSPLARAVPQEIFRAVFPGIFEAFVLGGTAEAYIEVFKFIFGPDADVEFTVPGPGELEIDIEVSGVDIFDLIARNIVNSEIFFDDLVDHEGDTIAAQIFKRFVTQYELEQVLFELVPAGIFTDIDLTINNLEEE